MTSRLEIYGNKKTFKKSGVQCFALPLFSVTVPTQDIQPMDEIYNQVSYLEPWVAGKGVGTPSSAFCLLYKLFTLKLSVKQIRALLRHKDSPYIRALGFMYLRFGVDPRELWSWFEPYLQDEEPIVLKYNSQPTSIGKFVRDLLSKPKFFDVVLPRIPVTVQREMEKQLNERFPEDSKIVKKRKREDTPLKEPTTENETEAKEALVRLPHCETDTSKVKSSLESSLYWEDLKKRYGDTSGTLETQWTTQQDTETRTTRLPTAVKNYLQTY
ncbi:hypothetical protein GpartN1_g3190.t1 [Galdieria partita]|uniref:Pre-mRNA-splicing factor 38 n=1 Tax=Galdieria partita TaxID=83374 RepID=A0A9C7PVZ6_9RHOD|nr:hypothetical protein GpartN1_g3190.t1 [Galdieria partita]